ncbi:hypothetical protein ITP53_20080 [Nonomuraea sp. K274]|uniref:Uncharacterized protein n=1 Tax=Nonomuraea cypriaca TaxID=1187855 RepID=A0A931A7X5_9ACTN|nr:DUF5947 family protein [Nonomuraea cypriaca]MBF8187991.1 hypothetical protein [Nonomuraea cypriaca]
MSGLLRRLASGARERGEERCELCGEPLPAVHRHLLELPARELRCACRACQVLFDHGAAGGGHYRLVPERRRRLCGFRLDEETWARLRAPVRTVFLVDDSAAGLPILHYPSPAGAVRAPVDQGAWALLRRDNPALLQLRPDVEALLADRDRGAWIVPVDDCYALVGAIRTRWRGLTGGADVRRHIAQFFTDLDDRSVTVPATDSDRSSA